MTIFYEWSRSLYYVFNKFFKSFCYSFQQINKLSGVVILKMIKEINPSIQVIVFTASSDSMILDEISNEGILGYVKKDAPAERYQAPLTSFKKLSKLVKFGLSKKYLKNIHFIESEILTLENIHKYPEIINKFNNL